MVFPLWLKLGLFFGGLIGTVLTAYGWMNFQNDLAYEKERRKKRLLGLAHAIAEAPGLGDQIQRFKDHESANRPAFRSVQTWLRGSREAMGVSWASIITKDSSDRFSFVIDSARSAPHPVGYPIFDGIDHKMAAWRGVDDFDPELADDMGLWILAYVPIKNSRDEVVALAEAADDANAKQLFEEKRGERLIWQLGLAVILSILLAIVFARYLNRFLQHLAKSARRVAAGDLTTVVVVPTRDELGVLGDSFNGMIRGLKDREFIRETFGRFVTQEVADEVLQSNSIQLGGEEREVTILMSDLRGFTALSLALGPKELVQLLNRYFSVMSEVIVAHHGTISELLGDGMVVLFGAPRCAADDAIRAVACSIAMQRALAAFNDSENRHLEMGIGLNTGPVVAGNIGSPQRMKYGVVGSTINEAARIESFTVGGQVLACEATVKRAGLSNLVVDEPQEFMAKGRQMPLKCYSVRGVRGAFSVDLPKPPELNRRDIDRPVKLWPVIGKEVSLEAVGARAVGLGSRTVWLTCDHWAPERWANVVLSIRVASDCWVEGIYAKVVAKDLTTQTIELRFTALSDEAEAALAAI